MSNSQNIISRINKELRDGSFCELKQKTIGGIRIRLAKIFGLRKNSAYDSMCPTDGYYTTTETNETITIRLSNHLAKESQFKAKHNISIVISDNITVQSLTNSNIYTEVVYNADCFKANNITQTLNEILLGIKHALMTGEYIKGKMGQYSAIKEDLNGVGGNNLIPVEAYYAEKLINFKRLCNYIIWGSYKNASTNIYIIFDGHYSYAFCYHDSFHDPFLPIKITHCIFSTIIDNPSLTNAYELIVDPYDKGKCSLKQTDTKIPYDAFYLTKPEALNLTTSGLLEMTVNAGRVTIEESDTIVYNAKEKCNDTIYEFYYKNTPTWDTRTWLSPKPLYEMPFWRNYDFDKTNSTTEECNKVYLAPWRTLRELKITAEKLKLDGNAKISISKDDWCYDKHFREGERIECKWLELNFRHRKYDMSFHFCVPYTITTQKCGSMDNKTLYNDICSDFGVKPNVEYQNSRNRNSADTSYIYRPIFDQINNAFNIRMKAKNLLSLNFHTV